MKKTRQLAPLAFMACYESTTSRWMELGCRVHGRLTSWATTHTCAQTSPAIYRAQRSDWAAGTSPLTKIALASCLIVSGVFQLKQAAVRARHAFFASSNRNKPNKHISSFNYWSLQISSWRHIMASWAWDFREFMVRNIQVSKPLLRSTPSQWRPGLMP